MILSVNMFMKFKIIDVSIFEEHIDTCYFFNKRIDKIKIICSNLDSLKIILKYGIINIF